MITIIGNPIAQGRPKFFRRGSFVGVYDPKESKSWKENIKLQAMMQGAKKLDGGISMDMIFHMPMPKSLKKKILKSNLAHTKKPDLDNLVKAVKDALKGICYADDSQIAHLNVRKIYSLSPRVDISYGSM